MPTPEYAPGTVVKFPSGLTWTVVRVYPREVRIRIQDATSGMDRTTSVRRSEFDRDIEFAEPAPDGPQEPQ